MDSSVFFGGSVIAAVIAGTVALFAPCCISVMLPAYFATAFQNRRLLVAMTFLFAAGIATIILPLALGAQALQRLIVGQHTVLYVGMGLMLLALGAFTLLGGKMRLPMPGSRAGGRSGPVAVYTLGMFSGVATSCCAPVLAGVIALSGVASSFVTALGLGAAYVLGMVAPLFGIALLWDRYDWRSTRLFRPRSVSWRVGPLRRTVTVTAIVSGVLLMLMGVGTMLIGLLRDSMPAGSGWQAEVTVRLQHVGKLVTDTFAFVPGWMAAVLLALFVLALARRALRQLLQETSPEADVPPPAAEREREPEFV